MEDLKEALSRRVGTEVAVEEKEVQKLQQESYDGIVVRKENESRPKKLLCVAMQAKTYEKSKGVFTDDWEIIDLRE